jgi:hypothetical protein
MPHEQQDATSYLIDRDVTLISVGMHTTVASAHTNTPGPTSMASRWTRDAKRHTFGSGVRCTTPLVTHHWTSSALASGKIMTRLQHPPWPDLVAILIKLMKQGGQRPKRAVRPACYNHGRSPITLQLQRLTLHTLIDLEGPLLTDQQTVAPQTVAL